MKRFKPITPARRFFEVADYKLLTKEKPEKGLVCHQRKTSGRNMWGRITAPRRGGGAKKKYRLVDFKRDKKGVLAKVIRLEYDPNRSAYLALLYYADGEKRYILAPVGLKIGESLMAGEQAEIKEGNALPLNNIPLGTMIHNVELRRGAGGQLARAAGSYVQMVAKEGDYVHLRLPSGEIRLVLKDCYATIGQVGNVEYENISIGNAGRSRWLGIRPRVRGVAMNPVDHPMGGGEGKSSGGRHPCSPKGIKAKGLKTRKNKRTARFILRRRIKKGKG